MAEIQVVVPTEIQDSLRQWLASRGLVLFPIPVEDDLPTYGIAPARGVRPGDRGPLRCGKHDPAHWESICRRPLGHPGLHDWEAPYGPGGGGDAVGAGG